MHATTTTNIGNIYSGTFPKIPTKKRVYSMYVCLSNFSSSSPSTFLSYNRREAESLLKKEEEEKSIILLLLMVVEAGVVVYYAD
jgi:hypothetical protein